LKWHILIGICLPSAGTFSTVAYGIKVGDIATWVTSFYWWFASDVFFVEE